MVIQGIIAHPVHCLHDGSELEMPVFVHVLLAVANQSLGVDPHACFEPGPIPPICQLCHNAGKHGTLGSKVVGKAPKEKPKSMLCQKVWLKVRKFMGCDVSS